MTIIIYDIYYIIIKYIDIHSLMKYRRICKNIYKICKSYSLLGDENIYDLPLNFINYISKCNFSFELDINNLILSTDNIDIFKIYLKKINRKKILNLHDSSKKELFEKNFLDTYYNHITSFYNISTLYELLGSDICMLLDDLSNIKSFNPFSKFYIEHVDKIYIHSNIITDFIIEEIDRLQLNIKNNIYTINNILSCLDEYSIHTYYDINFIKWSDHFDKYFWKYFLIDNIDLYYFLYNSDHCTNLFKKYRDIILMYDRKNNIYQSHKFEFQSSIRNYNQYHYKCHDIDSENNWHKMFWKMDNHKSLNKMKQNNKYVGFYSNNKRYFLVQIRKDFKRSNNNFIYDHY